MGCGGSVPSATEFLATAQPAPAEGYVATGWPQSIKMKGWSNEVHASHAPSEGGAIAEMAQWVSNVQAEQSDDPSETANWISSGCGKGGCGIPETLAICDLDGQPLGTLKMPRHLSFGIGAQLKDSAGNVLALLCTAENKRPQGFSSSSYQVLVPRPQFQGQAPVSGSWYVWATIRRAPMTGTVQIANGQGAQIGKGHTYMGYVGWNLGNQKWKCENASGQGLTICTPTKGEKPARHNVQCAAGVDVALQVCLMYAAKLANDELFRADTTNDTTN